MHRIAHTDAIPKTYAGSDTAGGAATRVALNTGTADVERKIVVGADNESGQNLFSVGGVTANYSKNTLTASGGFIGNLTGTATSANKLNPTTRRPASANIAVVGDGSISTFKATTSMTTGKPMADGNIIHFEWDNTSGYSA